MKFSRELVMNACFVMEDDEIIKTRNSIPSIEVFKSKLKELCLEYSIDAHSVVIVQNLNDRGTSEGRLILNDTRQ